MHKEMDSTFLVLHLLDIYHFQLFFSYFITFFERIYEHIHAPLSGMDEKRFLYVF